jgi:integrase
MARIIDDSGTVTRCLLGPYADERDKLERAVLAVDRGRELATQLMGRWGFCADEATSLARERWRDILSHDLRRSWATHHMTDQDVDIHTMMSLGGLSSDAAVEPYLGQPTEARTGRVLSL